MTTATHTGTVANRRPAKSPTRSNPMNFGYSVTVTEIENDEKGAQVLDSFAQWALRCAERKAGAACA